MSQIESTIRQSPEIAPIDDRHAACPPVTTSPVQLFNGNSFDADGAYMVAIECLVMQGAFGDFLLIKGRLRKKMRNEK